MGSEERSQAILYAAKSTEDKRGSIEGQLEEGRDFARREGLEVIAEYSEEDVSAYRGNRGPELAAALQHAERIGGVLIAQHSDRLARGDGRQARDLVEIARALRRRCFLCMSPRKEEVNPGDTRIEDSLKIHPYEKALEAPMLVGGSALG